MPQVDAVRGILPRHGRPARQAIPATKEYLASTLAEEFVLGSTTAEDSNPNVNRRGRNAAGKSVLGANLDGPVDRQIGLIRLERPDGSPIALIANYAIHGTVLGGSNRLISGDVSGIVAEYVESKIGVPMLFINGAEGDVAPIHSVQPDFDHIGEFKSLLGDRILTTNKSIAAART